MPDQARPHPETPVSNTPMAAAPIVYNDDGSVAWDNMWDSFCALASEGGPPHRGTLLTASAEVDPHAPEYAFAAAEIIRGVQLVSGLRAEQADPGWIAIQCESSSQAEWLRDQILQENVEARTADQRLLVPVAAHYTVKGEIKNVITAVAKTTHYWQVHLPTEVKTALAWEAKWKTTLSKTKQRLSSLFGKKGRV